MHSSCGRRRVGPKHTPRLATVILLISLCSEILMTNKRMPWMLDPVGRSYADELIRRNSLAQVIDEKLEHFKIVLWQFVNKFMNVVHPQGTRFFLCEWESIQHWTHMDDSGHNGKSGEHLLAACISSLYKLNVRRGSGNDLQEDEGDASRWFHNTIT